MMFESIGPRPRCGVDVGFLIVNALKINMWDNGEKVSL
jgi:hypothetical protein